MAKRPATGTAEPARVGVVIAVGLTSVVDWGKFLPARRYASTGTSYGLCPCLFVCLSVTSRCSIETDGRNNLVFGMGDNQSYTVF